MNLIIILTCFLLIGIAFIANYPILIGFSAKIQCKHRKNVVIEYKNLADPVLNKRSEFLYRKYIRYGKNFLHDVAMVLSDKKTLILLLPKKAISDEDNQRLHHYYMLDAIHEHTSQPLGGELTCILVSWLIDEGLIRKRKT